MNFDDRPFIWATITGNYVDMYIYATTIDESKERLKVLSRNAFIQILIDDDMTWDPLNSIGWVYDLFVPGNLDR